MDEGSDSDSDYTEKLSDMVVQGISQMQLHQNATLGDFEKRLKLLELSAKEEAVKRQNAFASFESCLRKEVDSMETMAKDAVGGLAEMKSKVETLTLPKAVTPSPKSSR